MLFWKADVCLQMYDQYMKSNVDNCYSEDGPPLQVKKRGFDKSGIALHRLMLNRYFDYAHI
jgi:hypothetical protein